jgi:hypothetical protein
LPDVRLPSIPEKFKLTSEFRLLVACSWIAAPHLKQEQAEKIASLCEDGISWQEFLVLVRRHGVTSVAYTMLCSHAGEWLPEEIRESLKADHIQVSGQALRQTVELLRISRLLAERSIEMIPLKGVLLSQELYGNPAMRNTCDLDLLIKPQNLERADTLLKEAGYRCVFPESELTRPQMDYLTRGVHHFEYSHDTLQMRIELHWSSYLWTPQQTAELWLDSRKIEWMGESVTCLNDDMKVLFLADHGARHKWFCIKWLSDIVMLITRERSDDWSSLLALSERLGMKHVLAQTVLLVKWLYDLPVPDRLFCIREDEQLIVKLAGQAMIKIMAAESEILSEGRRMESFNNMAYWLKLKPSLSYGTLIRSFIIRPQDFKLLSLPAGLFWLYIPLRPFLWLWRNYVQK